METVESLVGRLVEDESGFKASGGYERLLHLLWNGHSPVPLKRALGGDGPHLGDLFWVAVDLKDVSPFVPEALLHLASSDKATAAYAAEVVLRGSREQEPLRVALEALRTADDAVRAHAVRVLAAQGLVRLAQLFQVAGWPWAAEIIRELEATPLTQELIQRLVDEESIDQQLVAGVLVRLASSKVVV